MTQRKPIMGPEQTQFLQVLDRDEAERRFQAALVLEPIGVESVPLQRALGRVLAADVTAGIDVPPFDRSNFDGFAVRARDTYGADELSPVELRLVAEPITPGMSPSCSIGPGEAVAIATGAVLPRGADAVVMVEFTETCGDSVQIYRSVAPGTGVMHAGSDIARGEIVLRCGELLTSRELGVLAAIGVASVPVWRRPRVAIISTGDELVGPGETLGNGQIYDSNAYMLAGAVQEQGGEPVILGIVPDDLDSLRATVRKALDYDVVLLSGGTSKGEGDLSYRVVRELPGPGIVAHGVALKPGKPICLAVAHPGPDRRPVPVVILPGFPTSAIFTFHEFVSPVIRRLAGLEPEPVGTVRARMAVRVNSDRGRTEYVLVGLVQGAEGPVAYPMGKGSGSVTAFARADGFVTVPRYQEIVAEGEEVRVQLLGVGLRTPDLVVMGSHCPGFDLLLSRLRHEGVRSRALWIGSLGGIEAAKRDECDLAGAHLYDARTGTYNVPFADRRVMVVRGYGRMQAIVFRADDGRFAGKTMEEIRELVRSDRRLRMANRNRGSGTRVLVDEFLGDARPDGYEVEFRTHNAVAAAVAQGRADWGIAVQHVARQVGLAWVPLREEQYDFFLPIARRNRPAVRRFLDLLKGAAVDMLQRFGFRTDGIGEIVWSPVPEQDRPAT